MQKVYVEKIKYIGGGEGLLFHYKRDNKACQSFNNLNKVKELLKDNKLKLIFV